MYLNHWQRGYKSDLKVDIFLIMLQFKNYSVNDYEKYFFRMVYYFSSCSWGLLPNAVIETKQNPDGGWSINIALLE